MQHADARFERKDPFPHIPFADLDTETAPGFIEAMGWIFLAFFVGVLLVGFLGL